MHSSVKGMFVLGQRREGGVERQRRMTEKGSDRNYYSNSLCHCLEICSPSPLFYLLSDSSLLHFPVCLLVYVFFVCFASRCSTCLPVLSKCLLFGCLSFTCKLVALLSVRLNQWCVCPSFTSYTLMYSSNAIFTH